MDPPTSCSPRTSWTTASTPRRRWWTTRSICAATRTFTASLPPTDVEPAETPQRLGDPAGRARSTRPRPVVATDPLFDRVRSGRASRHRGRRVSDRWPAFDRSDDGDLVARLLPDRELRHPHPGDFGERRRRRAADHRTDREESLESGHPRRVVAGGVLPTPVPRAVGDAELGGSRLCGAERRRDIGDAGRLRPTFA